MKKVFTLLFCAIVLAACNGTQDGDGTSSGPSELALSKTTLMMKVDGQATLATYICDLAFFAAVVCHPVFIFMA